MEEALERLGTELPCTGNDSVTWTASADQALGVQCHSVMCMRESVALSESMQSHAPDYGKSVLFKHYRVCVSAG